jgi:hypothetical protein
LSSVTFKQRSETVSQRGYSNDPSRIDPGPRAGHVAEVLAELMDGKCFPFGPFEGAFMAASGDANGTMRKYRFPPQARKSARADLVRSIMGWYRPKGGMKCHS